MIIREVAHTATDQYWRRPFAERLLEDSVVSTRTRHARRPGDLHALSLKLVQGGSERFTLPGRSILVDDDAFLLVDESSSYASRIDAHQYVESLHVFFSSRLVAETLGPRLQPADRLLGDDGPGGVRFASRLYAHDRQISPVLRYVARTAASGFRDEGWYREHLELLLIRLLDRHRRMIERIEALPGLKRATRIEIYRRIAQARDFIWTNYEQPLTIADVAAACSLSASHLHAHFKRLFACSPLRCLQAKRVAVACRLLADRAPLSEIAVRVGLESRSTFFRTFQRMTGLSPHHYRRSLAARRPGPVVSPGAGLHSVQ